MTLFSASKPNDAGGGDRNDLGLPFQKLIELLRREGFVVDANDYVELTAIFEKFADSENRDRLKYHLAPIICRNENEQRKFYQLYDQCFTLAPPTVHKKSRWWIWGAAILVLIGGIIGYLVMTPVIPSPPQAKICCNGVTTAIAPSLPVNTDIQFSNGCDGEKEEVIATWSFGDGTQPLTGGDLYHKFHRAGTYSVVLAVKDKWGQEATDTLPVTICDAIPAIAMEDADKFVGDTITISTFAKQEKNGRWSVRNEEDKLVFSDTGIKGEIKFVPVTPGSYTVTCEDLSSLCRGERTFTVNELRPYKMTIPDAGPQQLSRGELHVNWRYDLLLLALLVATILLSIPYLSRYRRKLRENGEAIRVTGDEPEFKGTQGPRQIPFEPKDKYIQTENSITKIAYRLMHRLQTGYPNLDIKKTIARSVRTYGLISPVLENSFTGVEYLVILDASYGNQQVNLFRYLVNTFIANNVPIDVYYFYNIPDKFYKEHSRQACDISDLQQRYPDSYVIIITNGHHFMHPALPALDKELVQQYEKWEKRIIVTPVSYNDWGAEERLLSKQFMLVPADIQGWSEILRLISVEQTGLSAFNSKAWLTYGAKEIDVEDPEELITYLNDDDLFQWLCAICIYHDFRWEVFLDIGRNVLNGANASYKVNYANLLKIVRIRWVAEGIIPTTVRLELLKRLSEKNELIARRAMLALLAESDTLIDSTSFSMEEKLMQQYANSFVLYSKDPDANRELEVHARKFTELWKKHKIADSATYTYLENKDGDWETPVAVAENSRKDRNISDFFTPPPLNKTSLVMAACGFIEILILVLLFLLHNRKERISEWDINNSLHFVNREVVSHADVKFLIPVNDCFRSFIGGDSAITFSLSGNQDTVLHLKDGLPDTVSITFVGVNVGALKQPPTFTVFSSSDTVSASVSMTNIHVSKGYITSFAGRACPKKDPDSAAKVPVGRTINIRYKRSLDRGTVQRFADRLNKQGFDVPGIEAKTYAGGNVVRYFDSSQLTDARRLKDVINTFADKNDRFMLQPSALRQRKRGQTSVIEIWIDHFGSVGAGIISFTATPNEIKASQSTTLTWKTDGCESVSIEGGGKRQSARSSGSQSSGPLSVTTTYTLSATCNGQLRRSVLTVPVAPSPCVIDYFAATPTEVSEGGDALLRWSTTGCSSLSVAGGNVSGNYPLSGSVNTGPLSSATAFALSASANGKTENANVTVEVRKPETTCVINSFSASPAKVDPGGNSTLTWNTTGCKSVSIDGLDAAGSLSLSGERYVGYLLKTTMYRLRAEGENGIVTKTATIQVGRERSKRVIWYSSGSIGIASQLEKNGTEVIKAESQGELLSDENSSADLFVIEVKNEMQQQQQQQVVRKGKDIGMSLIAIMPKAYKAKTVVYIADRKASKLAKEIRGLGVEQIVFDEKELLSIIEKLFSQR